MVHFRVDSSSSSYVILAVATSYSRGKTPFPVLLTYQSASKAWSVERTSGSGPGAGFSCEMSKVVVVNGVVYAQVDRDQIMALDTRTRVWTRACPAVPGLTALLQSGDRVMGVCDVRGAYSIYSLDVESSAMVFESEPDEGVAHVVRGFLDGELKTAACDGFLYIFSLHRCRGIMYDTSTKVWQPWSGCPRTRPLNSSLDPFEPRAREFEFGMTTDP